MTTLDTIVGKFRAKNPNIGAAFDEVQKRLAALEGPVVVPPPPPPSGFPTAPKAGGEVIKNAPTLGKNVTSKQDLKDITIDGCGDTAILFQGGSGGAAGSTLTRAKLLRVAELNAVSYGKHGIYGKAANLHLSDLEISCSTHAASGASLRYDGATLQRSSIDGASHAISYYETSAVRGSVLIEDVRGSFTGDTAVWMDAETDFQNAVYQSFVFRRVAFTGRDMFLKVSSGRMQGAVRIEACTLNGKAVTAQMVSGVPNLTIA